MVFDGLGNPPIEADVRLKGNRVIAIGKLATLAGEEVLDAFGLYVTPGFIDAHSHADGKIFDEPTAESQVRQGITCSVVGQDGGGRKPVREFFAKLTMQPGAIHYAAF
ncbi:MAG: amidohydrolase family protein, partial [Chthonomonas sp.]|nr:amidohydrolase family protein [Chthonomonas sp.]